MVVGQFLYLKFKCWLVYLEIIYYKNLKAESVSLDYSKADTCHILRLEKAGNRWNTNRCNSHWCYSLLAFLFVEFLILSSLFHLLPPFSYSSTLFLSTASVLSLLNLFGSELKLKKKKVVKKCWKTLLIQHPLAIIGYCSPFTLSFLIWVDR